MCNNVKPNIDWLVPDRFIARLTHQIWFYIVSKMLFPDSISVRSQQNDWKLRVYVSINSSGICEHNDKELLINIITILHNVYGFIVLKQKKKNPGYL